MRKKIGNPGSMLICSDFICREARLTLEIGAGWVVCWHAHLPVVLGHPHVVQLAVEVGQL
jgi:hypothetical protein